MPSFFQDIFSKHRCGFMKGFNTEQCLLTLMEKWRNAVNKGKSFGTLLTNLSKAFDWFNHELLIVKPNSYSFTFPALKIRKYLLNKKKGTST